MAPKKEPDKIPIIKREVTIGQLIGMAFSLFLIIATSWVNMYISIQAVKIEQASSSNNMTEVRMAIKESQAQQNIILQKLGSLEAKIEDLQRHNDNEGKNN